MRLTLEATTFELRHKSPQVAKALKAVFGEADPEFAMVLEKALPRAEPNLKYPVLREIHKRSLIIYNNLLTQMVSAIGKVLDSTTSGKSMANKPLLLEGGRLEKEVVPSLVKKAEAQKPDQLVRSVASIPEKEDLDEPVVDHTKAIAEQDERVFNRIKQVLIHKGYLASDFEPGGPLHGWSSNELAELLRKK